MSVSGISSNNLYELFYAQNNQNQSTQNQNGQSTPQQIESDFAQLGQDLQSGNLTQAQQDFPTLSSSQIGWSAAATNGANINNTSANSASSIQ